jgi:hypothetical protein
MPRNSKGQSGQYAVLSIGGPTTSTLSTSWTPVGEVTSFPFKLPKFATAPSTHLGSTIKTAVPVIQELTDYAVKTTRVTSDAGQLLVVAAYNGQIPYDFKVVFPINTAAGQTTAGDTWTWSAYVLDGDFNVDPDKLIDFNFNMQLDSTLSYTAGS